MSFLTKSAKIKIKYLYSNIDPVDIFTFMIQLRQYVKFLMKISIRKSTKTGE